MAGISLPHILIREKKIKRGLGKEFENKDNFPRLIKMSLNQEN